MPALRPVLCRRRYFWQQKLELLWCPTTYSQIDYASTADISAQLTFSIDLALFTLFCGGDRKLGSFPHHPRRLEQLSEFAYPKSRIPEYVSEKIEYSILATGVEISVISRSVNYRLMLSLMMYSVSN